MPKPKSKSRTTGVHNAAKPHRQSARKHAPALSGAEFERAVERFQNQGDDEKAHQQWKEIERSLFGADIDD